MSRKTVHGLFYIVSRTHLMHFVSLRGQYRQNQYLYTHHIIHTSGFYGFLSLHALLYRIFQHGSLEMGCLCHIFSGGKGREKVIAFPKSGLSPYLRESFSALKAVSPFNSTGTSESELSSSLQAVKKLNANNIVNTNNRFFFIIFYLNYT